MNTNLLISRYNLQPADVIITYKSQWKIVQHYAIYAGNYGGVDYYLENNNVQGVRWIEANYFDTLNPDLIGIKKFQGNRHQRAEAINRGIALVGTHYDLTKFNCEHYANVVQHDVSYSTQVDSARSTLAKVGLFAGMLLLISAVAKG